MCRTHRRRYDVRIQGVPLRIIAIAILETINQILASICTFLHIIALAYWNSQSNFDHNSLSYCAPSGMEYTLSSYIMNEDRF